MYDYVKIEKKFCDLSYKIIKQEKLWWGGFLSTVWLGLDHSFDILNHNRKPLIFETMLFYRNDSFGQVRYPTLDEAIQGHEDFRKSITLKVIATHLFSYYKYVLIQTLRSIKSYVKNI